MFELTRAPIVPPGAAATAAGGFVTFEGKVRPEHAARRVVALEYEAFDELVVAEGGRVVAEAVATFGLAEAHCIHRVGRLAVGETAVWIRVATPHRREAFEACEWIIDQLKCRVPIWKKEHFEEGDSGWIGSDVAPGEAPATEATYYARQVRLPEVGPGGQEKLKAARVLVVGAGGLGCAAIPYLAAAGVGTLGICDFDRVDATNLHRQVLYAAREVGRPKAALAARFALRLNPFIQVRVHAARLTAGTAPDLLRDYDVVLDCTDNFTTKFLLNDAAVAAGRPLVQASIHQFEGQLHVVDPRSGHGCLRCLWPDTPAEGCVNTCAEAGVLGVVPGVFGALQAGEAIKLLLGLDGVLLDASLLFDLRTGTALRVQRRADPHCPVCGDGRRRAEVDVDPFAPGWNLTDWIAVDLREEQEARPNVPLGVATWLHRPLSRIGEWLGALDRNQRHLFICSHGVRSGQLARRLRAEGWDNAFSLAGGIELARKTRPPPPS
jgi:adenylyltransferase/sulfurtransferase